MSRLDDDEAAVCLVGEILQARAAGDRDTCHGNGTEDLLGAIKEARPALARLEKATRGELAL